MSIWNTHHYNHSSFQYFCKIRGKKEDIKLVLIQILLQRELMENVQWKLLACLAGQWALFLNISLFILFLLHSKTETVQKYNTFFASSITYNTLNRYRLWLSSNTPAQERRKESQNQKCFSLHIKAFTFSKCNSLLNVNHWTRCNLAIYLYQKSSPTWLFSIWSLKNRLKSVWINFTQEKNVLIMQKLQWK